MKDFKAWLSENLLNLLVTFVTMAVAFALLNYRVNQLEAKAATYPSQDWFELKFQITDKNIEEVKALLKEHSDEGR
jgi:hypothetical protein